MALNGYLVEEISHDFSDGLLSRREALRRLGMLGLSVTGASAVLAACGDDDDDDGAATATSGTTAPGTASDEPPGAADAVDAKAITFGTSLQGAYAEAKSPKGAVLVVHENRGLTPHFFDVPRPASPAWLHRAGRRPALAPGRHGEGRRRGGRAGRAGQRGAAGPARRPARRHRRAGEAARRTRRSAPSGSASAAAWCGTCSTRARADSPPPRRSTARARRSRTSARPRPRCSAIYGETDNFVNADRGPGRGALKAAGLMHEIKTFAGRRPRLLQRHRPALQRHRGQTGMGGPHRLVRRVPLGPTVQHTDHVVR